jgi:ABC-type transport system involved in multi-copper enzyme maturation permease subunit
VTGALVRDTFREAMARKLFWGLFGLSAAMILFLLFILRIDVVEGGTAVLSLVWGSGQKMQDADAVVRGVYGGIATFLFTFGMFLSVFASAGLTPSLLEPGRIALLLSKPVTRTRLLMGRYLGNLLVVASNIAFLVLGVWTIIGWKTGIWRPEFLWTIPATVLCFAILLAVVVLVGVLSESGALAMMITFAMMIVSPILAQEKTMVKLLSSEWARTLWTWLYYVLPKPFDFGKMIWMIVRERPVESWMPVWSSAAFGVVMLAMALGFFLRKDY